MFIEELKEKKEKYNFTCKMISEASGVPMSTVLKVFSGVNENPRNSTLQKLSKGMTLLERQMRYVGYYDALTEMSKSKEGKKMSEDISIEEFKKRLSLDEVHDGAAAYQVNARNKTIDDFMALPEGTMIELIDGQFYDMAAPSIKHQDIAGEIHYQFKYFVKKNGGNCRPMIAPTAVRLDRDNKTMVLPDVLVCCNRDQIKKNWIDGAPDLIVEVLSPSNWYNDVKRKLDKYKNAGVREYWIINPEQRVVWVYFFEEGDTYKEYTFEDKIPVRIWNDKCVIDFKEISECI